MIALTVLVYVTASFCVLLNACLKNDKAEDFVCCPVKT